MALLLSWVKILLFGILVIASFCLLSILLSLGRGNTAQGADAASAATMILPSDMEASPNVVARVVTLAFNGTSNGIARLNNAIYDTPQTMRATAAHSSGAVASSSKLVVGGTWSGVAATARMVGGAVGVVVRWPGHVLSSAAHISVASIIQPTASSPVPTIEALGPDVAMTGAVKPLAHTAATPSPATSPVGPTFSTDETGIWPIHGMVTTLFGVPEPPYEPIHTGMDISDGHRAGVTPVHPFKSGRVIEVLHSGGLGNHVVVDHGGGLTSVYGHMSSTAVTAGQMVNQQTVLGYEGSTGVSTGPHVHFEIRVNNRPVNPGLYIEGRP